MHSRKVSAALTLLLLLISTVAQAAAPGTKDERRPVRVIQGEFASAGGETVKFQVADGGSLSIKNDDEGLYYRLSAKIGKGDRVELRLTHYADSKLEVRTAEEVFAPAADGRFASSGIAPFQLAVTGIKDALATPVQEIESRTIGCCIYCDGWFICCEVTTFSGIICCTVDTSCFTCSVCEWVIENPLFE